MNVFTTGLSPRLPVIQPLAQRVIPNRPVYQIWIDASGKGYGAHLGHAHILIALFQHRSLNFIHLLPPSASHPIDLPANNPQIHEAVSLYLCLTHWGSFLRGSRVRVHVDNLAVCRIHSGKSKGRGVVGVMMNAIKELVKAEDMVLDVKWLQGVHNRLANGLSRWVSTNSSKYSSAAKLMMQKHGQVSPTYLEAGGLVERNTDLVQSSTKAAGRKRRKIRRKAAKSAADTQSRRQTHKAGTFDLGYGKMGGEWTNIKSAMGSYSCLQYYTLEHCCVLMYLSSHQETLVTTTWLLERKPGSSDSGKLIVPEGQAIDRPIAIVINRQSPDPPML